MAKKTSNSEKVEIKSEGEKAIDNLVNFQFEHLYPKINNISDLYNTVILNNLLMFRTSPKCMTER